MGGEDADSDKSKQWSSPNRAYKGKEEDPKLWGLFLFGLIGATATTFAVSQLRRSVDWMFAQEEAWRRYNRRLQEEYEEEMERVERIRHMQSVFNRERNKYRRSYESWRENGPGAYNQHYQRDDWYWKAEAQFRDQRTNFRQPQRDSASCPLSHHYSVLGLDRSRTQPYTEDEIKTAFRAKAKQFHPDQNQKNKEAAEAKFKEVMTSYEAIKQERKNMRA
ncbi:Chaperone DnaJ [Gossypium arboreum]|uniref:Chaperone DnaJ n=1 Tax=Gossypium arboreum TaxID=29729 RepID=A0A0B0NK31_GOSAR|nr:Chaperone DnaJ [Gossypium arboreum]